MKLSNLLTIVYCVLLDAVNWESLDDKEKEVEQLKYRNKAVSKLNKSLYHWKPMQFVTTFLYFYYKC